MIGRTCSACWFVAIEPTIPQGPRHEPERIKAQEERALVFFFRFSTPLWHHVRVRICPACSREYPDERTHCQDDGIKLVVLDKAAAMRAEQLINELVRFIREAQTANALRSRHIVETTDFGHLRVYHLRGFTRDPLQRWR